MMGRSRLTEARSLDTDKAGHGFKNVFEACKTHRYNLRKSRPQRRKI